MFRGVPAFPIARRSHSDMTEKSHNETLYPVKRDEMRNILIPPQHNPDGRINTNNDTKRAQF